MDGIIIVLEKSRSTEVVEVKVEKEWRSGEWMKWTFSTMEAREEKRERAKKRKRVKRGKERVVQSPNEASTRETGRSHPGQTVNLSTFLTSFLLLHSASLSHLSSSSQLTSFYSTYMSSSSITDTERET